MKKFDNVSLTFRLDPKGVDKDARTVEAAISNATIVQDGNYGKVRLQHTAESIDLSRAESGMIMLFNHDSDNPIGRVENVRLDADEVLRGSFKFSAHESAARYWAQVEEGTLTDISVGANVVSWDVDETDEELVNITKWQPYEASIVSVGRIPSAKVGFSNDHKEENQMVDKVDTGQVPEKQTAAQVLAAKMQKDNDSVQLGIQKERQREAAIVKLFDKPRFQGSNYQVLARHCIDEGLSLNAARDELVEFIGLNDGGLDVMPYSPATHEKRVSFSETGSGKRTHVSMGQTGEEKISGGIELALSVKSGLATDDKARREAEGSGMLALSLLEMGREMLRARGGSQKFNDNMRLAHHLLMSHSTSDFPNVLANIASKAAMIGYQEAPETWSQWCSVGNLSDFKQAKRVTTTAFPDLDKIPESGEYKFATISDVGEPIQLGTYGKKFRISRQALINDDIAAFTSIPQKMGRAAARTPGNLAYAVLTANAALSQDSTTLFHADHSNYVASGSGAAPGVSTLQDAFLAMALQTDPDDNMVAMNLEPQFLIVPRALRSTGRILIGSEKDPTYDAANPGTPVNEFYNDLTVISDARLDTASSVGWYVAAAPSQADTIEVAFLNGNQMPVVDQMDMTSPDGRDYYVRLDCAAAALGYQGLYFNYGS